MAADLVERLEAAAERWPTGYESDRANVALLREAASALRSSGEAVASVCLVGERYAHGNMVEVQLRLASATAPAPNIGDRYYLHPATVTDEDVGRARAAFIASRGTYESDGPFSDDDFRAALESFVRPTPPASTKGG